MCDPHHKTKNDDSSRIGTTPPISKLVPTPLVPLPASYYEEASQTTMHHRYTDDSNRETLVREETLKLPWTSSGVFWNTTTVGTPVPSDHRTVKIEPSHVQTTEAYLKPIYTPTTSSTPTIALESSSLQLQGPGSILLCLGLFLLCLSSGRVG